MTVLCCDDCGKPYGEFPLDVVLPDDQWLTIYGRPGGVLCAACIVARGSKIHTVTVAKLHFPDLGGPTVTDTMVERACKVAYGPMWPTKSGHNDNLLRDMMRRILTEALLENSHA